MKAVVTRYTYYLLAKLRRDGRALGNGIPWRGQDSLEEEDPLPHGQTPRESGLGDACVIEGHAAPREWG